MRLRREVGGRASSANGKDHSALQFLGFLRRTRLTCVRNRGELSEGWYDPSTLQKAQNSEPATGDAPSDDRYRYGPEPVAAPRTERSEPVQHSLDEDSD